MLLTLFGGVSLAFAFATGRLWDSVAWPLAFITGFIAAMAALILMKLMIGVVWILCDARRRPVIEVSTATGEIRLGDTIDIRWKVMDHPERLRRLGIGLLCLARSTNTRPEDEAHRVLVDSDLFDASIPALGTEGTIKATFPVEALPTGKAGDEARTWMLSLTFEITSGYQPMSDRYTLTVLPAERGSNATITASVDAG